MKEGLAVTADGQVFRGMSKGAEGVSVGEVIFNTSMSGYQEILTDPSYAGQVIVMTLPHIGNYGVVAGDDQAPAPTAAGLIVRSLARRYSSWRADGSLADLLADRGIVALAGIDTRRLTRHIQSAGAMQIAIGTDVDVTELAELAAAAPVIDGRDLASNVTTSHAWTQPAFGERRGKVVALDLGIKRSIVRELAGQGLEVRVVPLNTPAESIIEQSPDGVFLSNGPGDPAALPLAIATVRLLLGRVPIFGICLGHQVLGLALGATTYKLPFGHHGGNHPVRRLIDGRIEVTAHNHGFAVNLTNLAGGDGETPVLPAADRLRTEFGEIVATHVNLNDGTVEGLACRDVDAFSVQYHPEAAPGPHDALHYFDHFADLIAQR
ncbi:MAG: glutamine-hydrolyzing carbamoyl-phosphate synthase small subunit [Acidimicrobiia bacterium]|nr:glutamine-hydrolyzing carbamoyl-phosphate synthase small subunit [Acidimicrobiia bacterium]MDH3396960.1 glutamine-hydrolyzing carbamoyl-phosphate synthase small subunit [Acidimicrobiia bacterium]MDH5616667.1 glutamine-hydrolyzing carbamoyl-phosphate synthase small subunit [Acidimicrobiia bacterium]